MFVFTRTPFCRNALKRILSAKSWYSRYELFQPVKVSPEEERGSPGPHEESRAVLTTRLGAVSRRLLSDKIEFHAVGNVTVVPHNAHLNVETGVGGYFRGVQLDVEVPVTV